MFNFLFNSVLFVGDVLCAISAYSSAHYVWACILSAFAGAMFMIMGDGWLSLTETKE